MGFGDVNYLGGVATTPFLNSLSESNHTIRADNFHSGSSICSPSRAAMISGRFPDRDCVSSVNDQMRLPRKNWPFRANMPSMGLDATKAGYSSLFLGKWNLGELSDRHPGVLGFKDWKVSLQNMLTYDSSCLCNSMQCQKSCSAFPFCIKGGYRDNCWSPDSLKCDLGHYKGSNARSPLQFECDLKQGVLMGQTNDAPYRFPVGSLNAVELAKQFDGWVGAINVNDPFLAVLAFYEPHTPFTTSPEIRAQCAAGTAFCKRPTARKEEQDYYGVVGHVDLAVQSVFDTLKRLDRYVDTLVVFASDNGPELGTPGSSGGLRGRKRQLWEGGTRVPGLLHWPRMISGNVRIGPKDTNRLTALIDVRVTIYDVLARENPMVFTADVVEKDLQKMDGVSWLPLIQAPESFVREKPYFVCDPGYCTTFSYYTGKWKIIVPLKAGKIAPQFYDMSVDFKEENNLASNSLQAFLQTQYQGRLLAQSVMKERKLFCAR